MTVQSALVFLLLVVALDAKLNLDLKDVKAFVGDEFELEIGDAAFLSVYKIQRVVEFGSRKLPDWLTYSRNTSVLSGVPLQNDVGKVTIKVKAICLDLISTCRNTSKSFNILVLEQVKDNTRGSHGYELHDGNLTASPTSLHVDEHSIQVSLHESESIENITAHHRHPCVPGEIVFYAVLILHVPKLLTGTERVSLIQRMASFISKPVDYFSLSPPVVDVVLLMTDTKHVLVSGPGNVIESLSQGLELTWHVACSDFFELDNFVKILQHNIEIGRITEEIDYDVIAWYVFSDRLWIKRQRRNRRQVTGTPSMTPPVPTTLFDMAVTTEMVVMTKEMTLSFSSPFSSTLEVSLFPSQSSSLISPESRYSSFPVSVYQTSSTLSGTTSPLLSFLPTPVTTERLSSHLTLQTMSAIGTSSRLESSFPAVSSFQSSVSDQHFSTPSPASVVRSSYNSVLSVSQVPSSTSMESALLTDVSSSTFLTTSLPSSQEQTTHASVTQSVVVMTTGLSQIIQPSSMVSSPDTSTDVFLSSSVTEKFSSGFSVPLNVTLTQSITTSLTVASSAEYRTSSEVVSLPVSSLPVTGMSGLTLSVSSSLVQTNSSIVSVPRSETSTLTSELTSLSLSSSLLFPSIRTPTFSTPSVVPSVSVTVSSAYSSMTSVSPLFSSVSSSSATEMVTASSIRLFNESTQVSVSDVTNTARSGLHSTIFTLPSVLESTSSSPLILPSVPETSIAITQTVSSILEPSTRQNDTLSSLSVTVTSVPETSFVTSPTMSSATEATTAGTLFMSSVAETPIPTPSVVTSSSTFSPSLFPSFTVASDYSSVVRSGTSTPLLPTIPVTYRTKTTFLSSYGVSHTPVVNSSSIGFVSNFSSASEISTTFLNISVSTRFSKHIESSLSSVRLVTDTMSVSIPQSVKPTTTSLSTSDIATESPVTSFVTSSSMLSDYIVSTSFASSASLSSSRLSTSSYKSEPVVSTFTTLSPPVPTSFKTDTMVSSAVASSTSLHRTFTPSYTQQSTMVASSPSLSTSQTVKVTSMTTSSSSLPLSSTSLPLSSSSLPLSSASLPLSSSSLPLSSASAILSSSPVTMETARTTVETDLSTLRVATTSLTPLVTMEVSNTSTRAETITMATSSYPMSSAFVPTLTSASTEEFTSLPVTQATTTDDTTTLSVPVTSVFSSSSSYFQQTVDLMTSATSVLPTSSLLMSSSVSLVQPSESSSVSRDTVSSSSPSVVVSSSVIVTPAPPDDPPTLLLPLDTLQVHVGRYYEFQIPSDTFTDKEDGETRNLTVSISLVYGKPLPKGVWLMFNSTSQTLYGIPLLQDIADSKMMTVTLTAMDSVGQFIRDPVHLTYNRSSLSEHSHKIIVTFNASYANFQAGRQNLIYVAHQMALFYGDSSLDYFTFHEMSPGSVVVTWSNNSFSGSLCDRDGILSVFERLVNTDGTVNENFTRYFSSDMTPVSVVLEFVGVCASLSTTEVPTKSPLQPAAGDSKLWIEVLLPALITVLLLVIVALILLIFCRHRRPGKDMSPSEKPTFLEDRRPIIFPEELEMVDPSLKPKHPLVLPSDYLTNKPPAVDPSAPRDAPRYHPPSGDDDVFMSDDRAPPPPPMYGSTTASDPPPYRLPPPYFNPHRPNH